MVEIHPPTRSVESKRQTLNLRCFHLIALKDRLQILDLEAWKRPRSSYQLGAFRSDLQHHRHRVRTVMVGIHPATSCVSIPMGFHQQGHGENKENELGANCSCEGWTAACDSQKKKRIKR